MLLRHNRGFNLVELMVAMVAGGEALFIGRQV